MSAPNSPSQTDSLSGLLSCDLLANRAGTLGNVSARTQCKVPCPCCTRDVWLRLVRRGISRFPNNDLPHARFFDHASSFGRSLHAPTCVGLDFLAVRGVRVRSPFGRGNCLSEFRTERLSLRLLLRGAAMAFRARTFGRGRGNRSSRSLGTDEVFGFVLRLSPIGLRKYVPLGIIVSMAACGMNSGHSLSTTMRISSEVTSIHSISAR
jgi:hypothetical protein